MNNKEKAREIAENDDLYGNTDYKSAIDQCYISAIEMAKWKDKQFAEQKQAQKNLPRFIMLHLSNNEEIIVNVESIKMIKRFEYHISSTSVRAYVYIPEAIETTETYEEIKAMLKL